MADHWLLEHRRLYDESGRLREPPHAVGSSGVCRVSHRMHELVTALEQAVSDFATAAEQGDAAKATEMFSRITLARECLYPYLSQLETGARVPREVVLRF